MTENRAIAIIKNTNFVTNSKDIIKAFDVAIQALEEVQLYRQIGTVEGCRANRDFKDFLNFISDTMNPNDFETYLRLYNALEEKGCEE